MNFMPFSKYNMGIAISLILVVLLSQSKIFNFFLNTILGKIVLITLLVIIASIHKILGVVVILFIIIFFSSSDLAYTEGLTNNSKMSGTNKLAKDKVSQNNTNTTSNTTSNTTIPSTTSMPPVTPKKPPATAKEGFDITGTENNIKRGKQSNSIPVNDMVRMSSDVLPHEGNSFSAFSHMV
jgi:cytoskeletal protein RodZ